MRAGVVTRVVAVSTAVAVAAALTLPGRAAAQAPDTTSPQPSKVVRIPFPRDDGTLTPYTFQLGYPLLNLVYDTLLWRDTAGAPRPWLAQALETNPEATRFTLRLTPGVRWHDGTPLTAEDVRFTFRYVAARPSPRFTAEVADVANVTAPNATTIVITMKRPSPGFADQTLSDLPILPRHLWENLPAGQTPPGLAVGSGPYRLVERLEAGGYRFEANAGYFKGAPTVAQVAVPIINDLDGTLRAFQGRNVDMVPLRLPPPEVRAIEDGSARVARGPSFWGVQLVFNMRRAPFNDQATRQAVAKAIDLDRLARTVDDAVPATQGMVHPESAWAPGQPLKVTDEAGAKVALAPLAGSAQPLEVLSADNDPVHQESARQVALALTRAGVNATSTTRSVAEMGKALGSDGADPSFSLAVTTLGPAASYDPDYLARLFGTSTATTSGYSSKAFDEVARRVAVTVDPSARRSAATEQLRLLASDLPALPLIFPNGAFVFRSTAHDGWQYVRGIGILDKQSFLPAGPSQESGPGTTASSPPTSARSPSATTPPASSGGGLPTGLLPIAFVAAGLALVGVALARRRR